LQTYLNATLEKKITFETSRRKAGGMVIAHARKRRGKNHRSPITLCDGISYQELQVHYGWGSYHLQSPHTPNPDLDWPIDALHVVQLNTLPPAAAGRLPPKQEKLLGHTHGIVV
jgi:hypothetical protein